MNPAKSQIQAYYNSFEARIGYAIFLGGTRHFGYYFSDKSWPWPIGPALERMNSVLLGKLNTHPEERVLDAGCGEGYVAIYMARKGQLYVEGIDLTPHHVVKARANVLRAGLSDRVKIREGDYHDLSDFENASFDAVYAMETLVHASHPDNVLQEFFRVLKPGGRLVLHDWDHTDRAKMPSKYSGLVFDRINSGSGMPTFSSSNTDDHQRMMAEAGFSDIEQRDLSKNIVPMLWLFYIFALVPFTILWLFGIEEWFPSTSAGVISYVYRDYWRYLQVVGTKPGGKK
ncbi:MAG: hypothetical protein GOMPHAMPRED_005909 [Gomphillus americanus]|uniref:Methyltransferase type 11 domain-containing protein n=1 Tax=Gomphillus americanus TaxID=1940652 RepID=A0A8H3FUP7_9LECA|nr:MAG: hypothetical protein GOMPHAMPRED_005909 [Gomphillus americanus]